MLVWRATVGSACSYPFGIISIINRIDDSPSEVGVSFPPSTSTTTDLAAAARWLDPSLAPGAQQAATRVVERIVQMPMTSHPVTTGLCSLVPGAGTTTTMAAIAGYLCRQGHPVLLAETLLEGGLPALPFVGRTMPPGVQWVTGTPERIAQTAQQHKWR